MVDTHCHLADDVFEPDLEAVVARARAAGVTGAVCILAAGDADEMRRAARVGAAWPSVAFAVGVHPHQAHQCEGQPGRAETWIRETASQRQVVAVGEIGLDYHYDFSPRDVQRDVFAEQLAVARASDQPVVIHTREADDDTFDVLATEGRGLRGVFHCFTGSPDDMRLLLDFGAMVSFTGVVTFANAPEVREAAKLPPLDRIMVETDSPFLTPEPYRKVRPNEPKYAMTTARALADLRGETWDAFHAAINRNTERFFGIAGVE